MRIIGIGTDIIECLRISKMISKHGELFVGRVYTDSEIRYCSSQKLATQCYSAHWAAKEAVVKSLAAGWGKGFGWRHIEIRHDAGNLPTVRLYGAAREAADRLGVTKVQITLSHSRNHAVGFAIASGPEEEEY